MEFREGQPVTWAAWCLVYPAKYGTGPFEIVRVETVSTEHCTCGNRLDDGYHDDGCFYNISGRDHKPVREAVGHAQYVWVKMLDGEHQFSGAYFTAA